MFISFRALVNRRCWAKCFHPWIMLLMSSRPDLRNTVSMESMSFFRCRSFSRSAFPAATSSVHARRLWLLRSTSCFAMRRSTFAMLVPLIALKRRERSLSAFHSWTVAATIILPVLSILRRNVSKICFFLALACLAPSARVCHSRTMISMRALLDWLNPLSMELMSFWWACSASLSNLIDATALVQPMKVWERSAIFSLASMLSMCDMLEPLMCLSFAAAWANWCHSRCTIWSSCKPWRAKCFSSAAMVRRVRSASRSAFKRLVSSKRLLSSSMSRFASSSSRLRLAVEVSTAQLRKQLLFNNSSALRMRRRTLEVFSNFFCKAAWAESTTIRQALKHPTTNCPDDSANCFSNAWRTLCRA
mmetsp:Transcript_15441/g.32504  ORF Transcript_15441/g.32504 Transcript_15441/m.32504 type:complete len:361 (-) Transcript_15441:1469-2551(-)